MNGQLGRFPSVDRKKRSVDGQRQELRPHDFSARPRNPTRGALSQGVQSPVYGWFDAALLNRNLAALADGRFRNPIDTFNDHADRESANVWEDRV